MIDPGRAYEQCVEQLRDFVHDNSFEQVIIGLSGGIDSSVVAVMAVDALGAENVHGLLLPGPYSSLSSIEDSLELAANVGMDTKTVSIDEPYQAFMRELQDATGHDITGIAAENTQARCRMICIMALANSNGWMMLNTGNKSEAAMGYSTLYGDTSGAYAPIGGLYKTEVYSVARWRNDMAATRGEVPPIPENVMIKPPSAELSPDQKDEASMGIDYTTLDAILIGLYEDGNTSTDLVAEGLPESQINMVQKRYDSYAFKRAIEPPYAVITRNL